MLLIPRSERWAPGTKAPGALSSLHERGLFDHRGDFLRMDDEGGMAAGDLCRLGLHPGGEHLLGLGRDDLVLRADHIELGCRQAAVSTGASCCVVNGS